MGIKGLSRFIRKTCPNIYETKHISVFQNQSIAIDISCFLYKFKAFNNNWIDSITRLLKSLQKNNVIPIVVADGKSPELKINTQNKRTEKKQKQNNDYQIAKNLLQQYKLNSIITEEFKQILDKCLELYKNDSEIELYQLLGVEERDINIKCLEMYISKLDSQIINISFQDMNTLKELCKDLQIQYIQAPNEAETMCCYLVNTGVAQCILSEDSDCFVYDVSYIMNEYNVYSGDCIIISKLNLLNNLSFTQQEFMDFCIMCGTDYNDNIPKIGITRAFKIIKDVKSIDYIDNPNKTILNHIVVREMFLKFGGLLSS